MQNILQKVLVITLNERYYTVIPAALIDQTEKTMKYSEYKSYLTNDAVHVLAIALAIIEKAEFSLIYCLVPGFKVIN